MLRKINEGAAELLGWRNRIRLDSRLGVLIDGIWSRRRRRGVFHRCAFNRRLDLIF